MNKYLHLGTLVAALSIGCGCYQTALPDTPVYPDESAKPTEPVKETEPQQPKEEFKMPYFCDKVNLQDGNYDVSSPVMPATYSVRENGTKCGLLLRRLNVPEFVLDLGCDNTMDFDYIGEVRFSREQIAEEGGDLNIFDQALRLGQSFVCKENRIKE